MENLQELVAGRKSVRTYDGRRLTQEDRQKILAYAETIENPFGVPVRFVYIDGSAPNLTSKVLTGVNEYIAAMVEPVPMADEAYGFSLEKLVLYAWSLGIGTVWIGGTMNRDAFEAAAGRKATERMPCITPVGYPAAKRSVRDVMMRAGIRADERIDGSKLFFRGGLTAPLTDAPQWMEQALEAVRWAPSAVNRQPWRVAVVGNTAHFYEKQNKGMVSEQTGDLQRIDVGIGLCHYVLSLEQQNVPFRVTEADPGLDAPEGTRYVASVCAEV